MRKLGEKIAECLYRLRERGGMTLVELMVALTLFLGATVLFSRILRLSVRIYTRSEQNRAASEAFVGSFYRHGTNEDVTGDLTLGRTGGESIPIYGGIGKYASSGRIMYSFESE